jgi:hypothetical protein
MGKNEAAWVAIPALVLAVLIAFAALTPVSDKREKSEEPQAQGNSASTIAQGRLDPSPARVSPSLPVARIAERFYRKPKDVAPRQPAPEIPEQPKPVEPKSAPWISFLGIVGGKGGTRYYFKDSRSNRIIALAEGEREGEWLLVEKESGGFVLEVERERYRVTSLPH